MLNKNHCLIERMVPSIFLSTVHVLHEEVAHAPNNVNGGPYLSWQGDNFNKVDKNIFSCPFQEISVLFTLKYYLLSKKIDKQNKFNSLQVNNYEIVGKFFLISHNLTWYSEIVHKFTRIYPVCLTYIWTVKTIRVNLCKKLRNRSQKE